MREVVEMSDTDAAVSETIEAEAVSAPALTMESPERFVNREISWLGFNLRVL
jgi:polyphosphate kinase